ncbi:MAG: DUF4838 domain-containing protein [Verrucomicrobia bacterium]|nr:DUF4838 domain-containing protein [Verrucomicrobiota bacterium]
MKPNSIPNPDASCPLPLKLARSYIENLEGDAPSAPPSALTEQRPPKFLLVSGFGHILPFGLLLASLALPGRAANETELTLVRDGKPSASIVIAKEPTRAAAFAARELQYHLKQITGAEVTITEVTSDEWSPLSGDRRVTSEKTGDGKASILVGESAATVALGLKSADFQPQEYLIRFQPNLLVLMGRDKEDRGKMDYADYGSFPGFYDDQATCYAVYDFLERFCRVRWYLPTELGLVCPKNATLRVKGAEIRRAPFIKCRQETMYPFPADLCGDTITRDKPIPILAWHDHHLWFHRMRIGGEPYVACHSFYGYYDRFWKKNPKNEKVFEAEHPDWFAQGYAPEQPPQLCYTNPGLIQQVVQDARDYFDGKGKKFQALADGDYFCLGAMDNGGWCKCAKCQALLKKEATRGKGQFSSDRASDYVFAFVNCVARELKKTHPDKFLSTIAYAENCYPPERAPVESNVSVSLCLHGRAVYSKTIQDNDRAVFDSWAKAAPASRKFLYFYYCFPSLAATQSHFRCFPGFFAHDLAKQLQGYFPRSVRGLVYEPSYLADSRRSALMDQVEFNVTWKLADDPTLDSKALVAEFFRLYYGAAAKPMQEFYERVEEIYGNPDNYPPNPGHQTDEIAWTRLGTEERMQGLAKLMEQARAAAQTDLEKQRMALFDKGLWQYMAMSWRKSQKKVASGETTRVPRVAPPPSENDWQKIAWAKGAALGQWFTLKGDPTPRPIEGRVLHDGKYLYLQLEEKLDPAKLLCRDNQIWNEDDWEIFVAAALDKPRRQMGINARGAHQDLARGERDFEWDSGAKVVSDPRAPSGWIVRIAFPLEKLLPDGAAPGGAFCLNVIRATAARNAVTWMPTFAGCPDALGKLCLEP